MRLIILFIILFITGCENLQIQELKTYELEPYFSLSTDKELYHSDEMMNITFSIDSEIKNNITVRIYGIYASRNRLDMKKDVQLIPGDNEIIFNYMTPKCTGCLGINPGTYEINAEFYKDGKTVGSVKKDIEVRQ